MCHWSSDKFHCIELGFAEDNCSDVVYHKYRHDVDRYEDENCRQRNISTPIAIVEWFSSPEVQRIQGLLLVESNGT